MASGTRPLLAQTLQMNTDESPMKDFVGAARAAEREGLLAATAFGGFQQADIYDAGISVVTIADDDRAPAGARMQRDPRRCLEAQGRLHLPGPAARAGDRAREGDGGTRGRPQFCCSITPTTARRARRRTRCTC